MLLAYADESGHAADLNCRHVGMAGIVAPSDKWEEFDSLWVAILERYGLQNFHMREYAHRRGPFADWPEEKRRSLMNELLDAIASLSPTIVGSVISMQAWRALPESDTEMLVDPYYCCVQEFVFMADVHGATVGDDKVSIILSQNTEFRGKAKSLADVLLNSKTMPGSLDSIRYADMREEPGLQAADLVAYETMLAHDQVAGGASRVRYPFQRICENVHFFRYIEEDWLNCQLDLPRRLDLTSPHVADREESSSV